MTFRASSVIKALGDPRLKLVAGKGYWYFIFDDVKASVFETHTVPVMRLNQLPLKEWVAEGRDFIAKVKSKRRVST